MSQARVDRILSALQRGQAAQALAEACILAREYPQHEAVLSLQATCAQQAGELAQADALLTTLTERFPNTWQHWNNLGNLSRSRGDALRARKAYERALVLQPSATRTRANLGVLLLSEGDLVAAANTLEIAAQSVDAECSMRIWAAVAHQALGDAAAVDALLSGWRQWPRGSEESLLELGWLLGERGEIDAALSILASIRSDPDMAIRATARRVLLLERLNRLDDAREALAELPTENGTSSAEARQECLHAKARLAWRERRLSDARRDLEHALAIGEVRRGRSGLLFALARVLDQLEEPSEALRILEEAHAMRSWPAASPDAPPNGWLAWLIERKVPAAIVPAVDSAGTSETAVVETPIFVLGFPRSGTTLLEQMLSAHPMLVSMDERPLILDAVRALTAHGLAYPDVLPALVPELVDKMRATYWRSAAHHVLREPTQHLVDKNPLNMLMLPMILRLFPKGRVIRCVRHPCDTILSCHFQSFNDPEVASMSASLPRLAESYAAFDRRFHADADALGADVLVLRYEDLVEKTDTALAHIGAYLGLEQVEAMKGFVVHAARRGFISTPSYAQVVEPLRRDSIGRWRRYEAHFRPLLPLLGEALSDGGYAC